MVTLWLAFSGTARWLSSGRPGPSPFPGAHPPWELPSWQGHSPGRRWPPAPPFPVAGVGGGAAPGTAPPGLSLAGELWPRPHQTGAGQAGAGLLQACAESWPVGLLRVSGRRAAVSVDSVWRPCQQGAGRGPSFVGSSSRFALCPGAGLGVGLGALTEHHHASVQRPCPPTAPGVQVWRLRLRGVRCWLNRPVRGAVSPHPKASHI